MIWLSSRTHLIFLPGHGQLLLLLPRHSPTFSLSLFDVALAMKVLCKMTPSLKLLSLAILLAPISSVLASNDCAASTWSKAGLKIRQVKTSSTSKSPLSSSSSASLVHSIISSSSKASTSTTSTSSASAATSSTATDIISVGNVTAGQVNCRYSGTTDSDVNYYTCTLLSQFYGISNQVFFTLNPGLALDCSNIQPNTPYCVSGCKFEFP